MKIDSRLSPEWRLLLLAARISPTPEQAEGIRGLVRSGIDWQLLTRLAARHNLLSLLYLNLKEICWAELPLEIAEALEGLFISLEAKNLFLSYALEMLLDRFEEQGIEAVPFKGPALALSAYRDLAARGFVDLDILIGRADLNAVCVILKANSYRPELDLGVEQLSAFSCHEDNLAFYNKDGVHIELHWELSGLYLARPVSLGDLQSSLTNIRLTEREVSHLPAVIQLVYLGVHGAKHLWERIEWLSCIHELSRAVPESEWPATLELAESWQCRRMFLLGLALCRELLDTELSETIRNEIKADPQLANLSRQVKHQIFQGRPNDPVGGLEKRFSLFHLQVRDNLRDTIRYLLRLFFRPSQVEWRLLPLPASLSFLYYIFRPVRLLYAGVGRIITSAKGGVKR
jgi:hypothetical protein